MLKRLPKSLLLMCIAALFAASCIWAFMQIERLLIKRASDRAEGTLAIAVEGLQSTLERFEPLPKLIAERPILVDLLKSPKNQGIAPFVNEQLRLSAMTLGVSDVYLMDVTGNTIAASSYRKELSFIGQNFNYRPYFQQAVEGGLGQFFALGTTSGERGYFFASPVLDNTRILGVLAIKFRVDEFETAWREGESDIIVADLDGVVFMSSRADWHFRTLAPLDETALKRIETTRRYPLDSLAPLNANVQPLIETADRVTVGPSESFLRNSAMMPTVGWSVQLLTPIQPIRDQALLLVSLGAASLLLAILTVFLIYQRAARARELVAAQRLANEELERAVTLRTQDLNAANAQLRAEILERMETEKRLRHTQKELVHAGKLAALGKLSAAISHEINQPLAAMKAYADNAAALLARRREDDVRDNLGRISQMTDRIASISGHLRNFARRPQETIGPVHLETVLRDVEDLMAARLKSENVTFSREDAGDILVSGGRIRLEQVLVNLVNNAIDATEGMESRISIEISEPAPDHVQIFVRDNGPGFAPDVLDQLFDPFFTTKAPGKGMGLGLSISHNIVTDFDGRMFAGNNPDTGAFVAVELRRTARLEAAQ